MEKYHVVIYKVGNKSLKPPGHGAPTTDGALQHLSEPLNNNSSFICKFNIISFTPNHI